MDYRHTLLVSLVATIYILVLAAINRKTRQHCWFSTRFTSTTTIHQTEILHLRYSIHQMQISILIQQIYSFFFWGKFHLCFVRGKCVSCKMPAFSKITSGRHSFSHVPTHLFYGEVPQYTSSERSGLAVQLKTGL